jgi:hypothetical protein
LVSKTRAAVSSRKRSRSSIAHTKLSPCSCLQRHASRFLAPCEWTARCSQMKRRKPKAKLVASGTRLNVSSHQRTTSRPALLPLKRSAIASPSSRHATAKESSVLALCCACPRNKGDYWCTIETLSLHFSRTHNCRIAHGFSAPTELHTPPTKPKIYVCRKAARAGSAKAKAKAKAKARANRWLPGRRPPLRPRHRAHKTEAAVRGRTCSFLRR